jgi:hypothetical protein
MQVFKDDVRCYPELFSLIETQTDLIEVEQEQRALYGIFSMEGASPLCGDMKMLEIFYRR